MTCEFSDPKTFDGGIPKNKQDFWQYSKITCESEGGNNDIPDYIIPIEEGENKFYLSNTITLGDFLIVAFLIVLFCGLAVSFIRDFTKNRKLERL